MKIKLTKSDIFVIALFFVIAIPVTFSGYDYSKGLFEPSMDTIIYCIVTLFLAYTIVYQLFPKFFPENRIIALFFWTALLMMIVGVIEICAYRLVNAKELGPLFKRYELFFWGISTSAENAGILIGILLGKKFYEAQLTLQKRDKEKKENELRLLKSQIDPHFLFNNLNTVDALIDRDPIAAKTYINKLSSLYRYLIQTKDDEVIPLDQELTFIKNYIYLLEQRFGRTYQFEIKSTVNNQGQLIPPGALQTLIENVVKHNQGSEVDPIYTTISISKETIEVSCNIQLKNASKDSFGTGLSNLIARYKLLTDKKIIIQKDLKYKTTLPVINAVS